MSYHVALAERGYIHVFKSLMAQTIGQGKGRIFFTMDDVSVSRTLFKVSGPIEQLAAIGMGAEAVHHDHFGPARVFLPEDPDLLVLIGTLGGISLFGAVGFILGPIVASLFLAVWDLYGEAFEDVLPAAHIPDIGGDGPDDGADVDADR